MKAAILGVGTELTDGTIANSNASWISKKLKTKGLITESHLVVPDDRPLILQGLKDISRHADLIFITGGLGPTSDDFTREVIATWIGKSLKYDSASWEYITERLTSRGYQVKEIQKQQCYFPEDSQILFNRNGTAHGFYCQYGVKHIFVLPGPPSEIAAIWQDSIDAWLDEKTQHTDAYITRLWDTMGLGESDIATIVEDVFKGQNYLIGYRVHLPYVEVKISYWKSEETKASEKIQELDVALKEYTITKDGKDIAHSLLQKLEGYKNFSICDEATGSFLLNRVLPLLKNSTKKMSWQFITDAPTEFEQTSNKYEVSIYIRETSDNSYMLEIKKGKKSHKAEIQTPYKTQNMLERRKQYIAELALIEWLQFLEN